MAARHREGATNRGAGKRKSTDNIGSPHWTGCARKNTGRHDRGHGAMKQRAWRESAEQHGAAWRSGPAKEGPRTHEDGGARGAPRCRAVLQPMGSIGEGGPTMGQPSERHTIPLHKASRLSGGYVECSPRRGSPRSGLQDCHGEVDVLPELIVECSAHREQEVASKGKGRTQGAALSPWRYGRREGETECTIRVEQSGEGGPRWLEMSHVVARLSRRITTGFERGSNPSYSYHLEGF